MNRLTQCDLEFLLECVRELYAESTVLRIADRLTASLPRVIPADIACYREIRPQSHELRFACFPVGAVGPHEIAAFQRHAEQHPIRAHSRHTAENGVYRLSDFASTSQFHALALYQECYRPLGIEYEISASLVLAPGIVAEIALDRRRCDFSERDCAVLEMLRPHAVQAYQNAEAISNSASSVSELRQLIVGHDRAVIILTGRGRIKDWTEEARLWVKQYCNAIFPQPAYRLPECFGNWYQRQLRLLDTVADIAHPRQPLVVRGETGCLTVHFIADHVNEEHMLLLEEQRAIATPETFGLTAREAEVLAWVAQGKTNPEIGQILNLSARTVQKHLEHVYQKLGVETRTAAVRRVQHALMPIGVRGVEAMR